MKLRLPCLAILCVWLGTIGVAALDGPQHLQPRALIDDIPLCGLSCLFASVPSTSCALDDYDCQCQNEGLAHELAACMLSNCTMADTLNAAKVQQKICHLPNESKQRQVYLYTIITYTVATTFVTLRVVSRIMTGKFAFDDCIVIVALLLATIPVGLVLRMAGIGFGEHIWNLQHGQLLQNLRFFYISWPIYTFVLGLTKVSILLFYLEIFTAPRVRVCSFILLGFVVTNTLVLVLLAIFNCIPVKAFWDRNIKKAKCLDISTIAYATSASAIAQDVLLLILPILCIWQLQMKTYRKVAVAFMFVVGTLGCVATMLRLRSLLSFKATVDPTWDYALPTIWTEIEMACCFVCLSLPSIRILLARTIPNNLRHFIASRFSSRMSTAPGMAGDTTLQDPISSRGRRIWSWMHIPSDDDRGRVRISDAETEIMMIPMGDKSREESTVQHVQVKSENADPEKELPAMRLSLQPWEEPLHDAIRRV